jgi:hypothetical protein
MVLSEFRSLTSGGGPGAIRAGSIPLSWRRRRSFGAEWATKRQRAIGKRNLRVAPKCTYLIECRQFDLFGEARSIKRHESIVSLVRRTAKPVFDHDHPMTAVDRVQHRG